MKSSPRHVVGAARRVVVPYDPKLQPLTLDACQKACPPQRPKERLTRCEEAPSTELFRDQQAPMAEELLLCRYEKLP